MLELDIKIEAGDLYDFLLAHTYNSGAGILGSCFGALLVVIAVLEKRWIFLALGVIVLLYQPCSLFLKSRRQMLSNPAFRKPLHYVLDEEGIAVSQDGDRQSQAWGDMVKASSTGKSIIVYTSRVNATIFPKRELGEQKTALIEMISTHMPPARVKIKQ